MSLRNDSPKETLCDRRTLNHPKATAAGQLVCPHCQTTFSTTWRRYLAAPWGNYRCPECRQISYARGNLWLELPILIVTMAIGGILGVMFAANVFRNGWMGVLFLLIGLLAVGLPFDKWMDGHLRHLKIRL